MHFSPSTFIEPIAFMRGAAPPSRMKDVREQLHAGGIDAGIAALNAGVPHRYTGIFRLDGDLLRNTHMFDKLGQAKPEGLETVVLKDSFCQIVLREGFFLTDNTEKEERLAYSPFKGVVMSYHGVPLLDNSAQLSGTLCHFDLVEQSITDEEFLCLQEAAKLFPKYLGR